MVQGYYLLQEESSLLRESYVHSVQYSKGKLKALRDQG
jgi:hypothetical protein